MRNADEPGDGGAGGWCCAGRNAVAVAWLWNAVALPGRRVGSLGLGALVVSSR